MKKPHLWIAIVTAIMLGTSVGVSASTGTQVPVNEHVLDNGMRLLLVERHDNPSVVGGWVAHVGSANEQAGVTGIAHLFEHMMFKGTSTIGTTDGMKELEIMSRLDAVRLEMEAEYTKLRGAKRRGKVQGSIYLPENRTPRLEKLFTQMKALQDEQHEFIVKDEYDKIYTAMGASSLNAFTNQDMTTYFANVPANKLELWFWMESERLMNAVFREFYSERDVVREERRMLVESNPTAKFEEQFESMFWNASPYHHPIIGWPSDVEAISRAQANEFFATYYAPNNITAAIVGDFEPDEVLALAEKYFGRIPRGETPPPEVVTEELEQLQERRMIAEADTNPSVQIRWRGVSFVNDDQHALDVLTSILAGRTGRLYKSLVEEHTMATGEPYAYLRAMKFDGLIEVGAELAEGVTHQEVEEALLGEISRLKNEPVSDHELQKVKNQSLADSYRRLQSNFFLMLQLLIYDAMGDWHFLNDSAAAIEAVTAEDIQRVSNEYFKNTGRNTLWYVRKEGSMEDPDLAALSGQAKQVAKQMIAQISQEEDVAHLQMAVAQMQAGIGQAPEEFRPALELVVKRIRERISLLEAEKGE
ncbi:MAG: insulinase family protein [Thermoanaerobaculales bacterium]|nr:insulinase family protein [Thermoanaerobaculales bacterium]